MQNNLQFQLLTLAGGERLLRVEHEPSGLSLERKLHRTKSLVSQKARLLQLFEAMLRSEVATA